MATDQEEYDREQEAARVARVESEAQLDDLSDVPPALIAKVARRVLAECRDYELLDVCDENFENALRGIGEVLHVPYVELLTAVHAVAGNPEVVRTDLADWVVWCQQHAPERLTAQKGGG